MATSAPTMKPPDPADASSPLGAPASPAIRFEHRVFSTFDGAYFRMSQDGVEPVFVINLADNELALPFRSIAAEFGIAPDSNDGRMLETIAECLTYVRFLRIGDPIPKELLSGEASWVVPAHSREIAYHKLTLGLVAWLNGDGKGISKAKDILKLADDPDFRATVREAFAETAVWLGYGAGGEEKVVKQIEELAYELAHIEALRERFTHVQAIQEKVARLMPYYGNETAMLELVLPVTRLIATAVAEFEGFLARADAQIEDVVTALREVPERRTALRGIRNDLYRRLMAWDEIFEGWARTPARRGVKTEALLRTTYRFLAPRFMYRDEWRLMSQRLASEEGGDGDGKAGVVSWYVGENVA